MIQVGAHRFSETDARRMLDLAPTVLDLMAQGRDPTPLEPVRAEVAAAIGRIDVASADLGEVATRLQLVWPLLLSASDRYRSLGLLPKPARGTVVQVATSGGGVPKAAVERLEVAASGAQGDRQRNRKHHGAPFQALCLWSLEVIERLRAEGHPLAPGAAGENVTISGLPWAEVRPGVRLTLGEVRCEVSSYAIPCAHNAQWFTDRDSTRIHHDRGPVSRVYATVLQPGRIEPGDVAQLEP